MKRIRYGFAMLLLICCWQESVLAQSRSHQLVDSLRIVLRNTKEDTAKVDLLNSLATLFVKMSEHEKGKQILDSSLSLSVKLNYKKGQALVYRLLGSIEFSKSNYPIATKQFTTSLKISEEIGYNSGVAEALNYIGLIDLSMGNVAEAEKKFNKALLLISDSGDKKVIANSYNNLGIIYAGRGEFSEALRYHNKALKSRKEIVDLFEISISYNNIGMVYKHQSNYIEALWNFQASFQISEYLGNKRGMAIFYNNIGLIYQEQGSYEEALKNYYSALKIREEISNPVGIASSYKSIGNIYRAMKNYEEALKNLLICLKIAEESKSKMTSAAVFLDIGEVYELQGNYEKALEYNSKALKIYEKTGFKRGIAISYNNIGNINRSKGNYQNAVKNYLTSLKILNDFDDKALKAKVCINIGNTLTRKANLEADPAKKKYSESILYLKRGLSTAKLIDSKESIKNAYEELSLVYRAKKNYAVALQYYDFYVKLKDSMINNETTRKLELMKIRFEVEKAVAQEQLQQKKSLADQKALSEKVLAEKKRKFDFLIAGISFLILALVFTFLLIRQRNRKSRAIEKAEAGHKMAELELQSLRAQLNPHFMFNSLNAIQDLIVNENNEKSQLYLARFSKLLRILLDNADQPFVSVKQEMEFLELYLALENLRIPDLKFSIEKDPKVNMGERMVPNMMLQPYIENAIWHGLSNKKGDRRLQIRIHENGNATEFEIEDNGVGRKKAEEMKSLYRKGHHSKGMELLSKRFNLLSKEYGEAIQTTVTDLGKNGDATGTLVKIDVPFSLSEQAKQIVHDTNHNN